MVSRRETLELLGASAAVLALNRPGFAQALRPASLATNQHWLGHLADSIAVDRIDSVPTVEGTLPPELAGTLYRNGPGLFERDHFRKSTILDGDGMIRAFTFENGRMRFRTRFVATEKLTSEARANRFLYPTWTTPAPGFFDIRFGPQSYVGEPVFVPCPKSQAEDAGWLLCEVLDGRVGLSDFAIFDAQTVSSGHIARVKLGHALPFSFHGWWQPA